MSAGADDFEEAWRMYPKRPNNVKGKARKAWHARIKAGVSPAVLVDGVRRYAAYVERDGLEPKFVKHAATFFGPDEHYLADYGEGEVAVRSTLDADGNPSDAVLRLFGGRPR